jgi:hypothetical protein
MMGPRYAGILGLIGYTVAIVRGLGHGASAGSTLAWAMAAMVSLAAAGYVLGRIAQQTVEGALQAHFAAEMARLAAVAAEREASRR